MQWISNGGDVDFYDKDGFTPLLAAASHGQSEIVDILLKAGADESLRLVEGDLLPVHLAAQDGDLETVRLLLEKNPQHRHAVCKINYHTPLLQAAFFGKEKHLKLAEYLLNSCATDTDLKNLICATNVRGYTALSMQDLWHNQPMKMLLSRYISTDGKDSGRTQQYYKSLLLDIAPKNPNPLTEQLIHAIELFILHAEQEARQQIDTLLDDPKLDINGLGGALGMTPLIFAVTGVDVGSEGEGEALKERARRRYSVTKQLLDAGADPCVLEQHPMAVGAVIRASVLNNFEILKLISEYLSPLAFAKELNRSPAVNGLTAMHDAVHRALTAPDQMQLQTHLDQITWMLSKGACLDIPDHTGQTPFQLAQAAQNDPSFPKENVDKVYQIIKMKEAACLYE